MAQRGFRLSQVLQHKRRLEDQKQLELRVLLAEEHGLRAAVQDLRSQIETHVSGLAGEVRSKLVDAAELESAARYLEQLGTLLEQRRMEIEESAVRVAACRAQLVTALQERRALEMLQVRQEAEVRREADRREAREMDDLVSARHGLAKIEKGASA